MWVSTAHLLPEKNCTCFVRVATLHQLFLIFLLYLPPPPLNPCRNVFGLKTSIVLRCFLGLMKNHVLVSVGWPAQQMGCWSTTDWEAKNTSCMVQRKVKNAIESHPLKKKNRVWCASSVAPPAPSLIQFAWGSSWYYHFFLKGEQVSARPRYA